MAAMASSIDPSDYFTTPALEAAALPCSVHHHQLSVTFSAALALLSSVMAACASLLSLADTGSSSAVAPVHAMSSSVTEVPALSTSEASTVITKS